MADLVTVKTPYGTLGTVPEASLQEALKSGFSIPSNEEIQAHNLKQEHGTGLGNAAKAFGEAAAGTATFGVSRELENALGITTPEAQKARAEYNPVARTFGDVAGIVTPLGVESVAGKAAMGAAKYANPVARVAEIGTRAGEAAAALAPEASFVGKVLKGGAQAGAEGVFYGAGQTVNEHAMGDSDLIGEKLLQNIGYGTLLSGTIGAGFGAAEHVVPKAVGFARDALAKARDSFLGGYAKASSFVSGKPEESIIEAMKMRHQLIDNPEEREKIAGDFANSLQDHFSHINNALKSANSEARSEEIKTLLSAMPAETAKLHSAHVWSAVDNALAETMEHAPLYPTSVPHKLQGLREEFVKAAGQAENAHEVFEAINTLKRKIDEKFPIFGRNITPEWRDSANLLKGLRSEIKQNLENESIWGTAAARQSAFNDAQNKFFTVVNKSNAFAKGFLGKAVTKSGQVVAKVDPSKVKTFLSQVNTLRSEAKGRALDDFFDASHGLLNELENTYKNAPSQKFDKEALNSLIQKNKTVAEVAQHQASIQKNLGMLHAGGHNAYLGEGAALFAGLHNPLLGAAIETINVLRNPGLTVQRLAKIEAAAQKATKMVERSAKAIFRTSVSGGKTLSGYAGARMASDDHDKREDRISRFVTDPEHAMNSMGGATDGLFQSAPQITAGLHATTIRGSHFLASKLPKRSAGPLDKKLSASGAEISKFNRYYDTVENPIGVLQDVKHGTVSPEQMETLAVVYPKLLNEMRMHVIENMANHSEVIGKGLVPYRTRLGVSMFLGQPTDLSLTPQAILANQTTFFVTPKQPQMQEKPSKSGMKNMTLASRTGLQPEEEA